MTERPLWTVATALFGIAIAYAVHLGREDASASPTLVPGRSRARPIAPRAAPPVPADAQELDWAVPLSYEHKPGLAGLPDALKALDGKKVVMHGFQLALYEYDEIREFALVANHMSCCFGMPPGINGQVLVKLAKGQRGLPWTREPLRVIGTFRVKEVMDSGYVLAIYAIEDAEAVIIGY